MCRVYIHACNINSNFYGIYVYIEMQQYIVIMLRAHKYGESNRYPSSAYDYNIFDSYAHVKFPIR